MDSTYILVGIIGTVSGILVSIIFYIIKGSISYANMDFHTKRNKDEIKKIKKGYTRKEVCKVKHANINTKLNELKSDIKDVDEKIDRLLKYNGYSKK